MTSLRTILCKTCITTHWTDCGLEWGMWQNVKGYHGLCLLSLESFCDAGGCRLGGWLQSWCMVQWFFSSIECKPVLTSLISFLFYCLWLQYQDCINYYVQVCECVVLWAILMSEYDASQFSAHRGPLQARFGSGHILTQWFAHDQDW